MSKKQLSGLLIGSAFVGGLYFILRKQSNGLTKRKQQRQVKRFLEEKFHDNEGILEIVDQMSDSDLQNAFEMIEKMKEDAKKIIVDKVPIKDKLQKLKKELQDVGQ